MLIWEMGVLQQEITTVNQRITKAQTIGEKKGQELTEPETTRRDVQTDATFAEEGAQQRKL